MPGTRDPVSKIEKKKWKEASIGIPYSIVILGIVDVGYGIRFDGHLSVRWSQTPFLMS